jgi:hypothetical protein
MKDGFYWARWASTPEVLARGNRRTLFVVEVYNGLVRHSYVEALEYFEQRAEFISKEPLTPPEAP